MSVEKPLEKQQIQLLVEALQALPGIKGLDVDETQKRGMWTDAKITIKPVGGKPVVLMIEAKSRSLFPRDVRDIIWTVNGDERFQVTNPPLALLEAYSLSQGAKDMLHQNNIGYFDSGGSLFIPAPGFYVLVDKPEPKPIEKKNRAMFRGKRAQVMHAMLQRHHQWVSLKDIAEEAEVAPATASDAMSMLDLFDWVSAQGNGPSKERRLNKPGAMLDAWVAQIKTGRPPVFRRYYVPRAEAEALARKVTTISNDLKLKCIVTGEVAAQHYTPHLSSISTVRCRVEIGARDKLVEALSAEQVDDGANLLILESREEADFLFSEKRDGLKLASPVIAYLDLIRAPGRAAELADHLRKEALGY